SPCGEDKAHFDRTWTATVPTLFEALIDPSGPGVGGERIACNIGKIGQTENSRAFSVPPEYADLLIKARRPCGRVDPDKPIVPADPRGGSWRRRSSERSWKPTW